MRFGQAPGSSVPRLDVNNLRLLPKFKKWVSDTFFLLFEHVVKARDWQIVTTSEPGYDTLFKHLHD